jgi:hypothetical protein
MKITKSLNEIQEKARRIQAGMCTEPKLTSNSQLAAVASLRVRNPRNRSSPETFLFGKFVREQGRS